MAARADFGFVATGYHCSGSTLETLLTEVTTEKKTLGAPRGRRQMPLGPHRQSRRTRCLPATWRGADIVQGPRDCVRPPGAARSVPWRAQNRLDCLAHPPRISAMRATAAV